MDAAGDSRRPAVSGCAPPGAGGWRRQQQHQQEGRLHEKEPQCCCASSSVHTTSLMRTPACCCHHKSAAVNPTGTAAAAGATAAASRAAGGAGAEAEAARSAAIRGEATVSAATASGWVARAASLRCSLLESALPVKISLDGSEVAALQPPPPLLLLLLRNSYLPHIFATCYEHFQLALRPCFGEANRCPPSFTYQGRLLDWRVPVGVSFDCFAATAPAVVTAPHHRTRFGAAAAQRRRQRKAAALAPCQRRRHGGNLGRCAVRATSGGVNSSSISAAAQPCCVCYGSRDACSVRRNRVGDAPLSSGSTSRSLFVCGSCSRSSCFSCSGSRCCSASANDRSRSSSSAPRNSQAATGGDAVLNADKEIAGATSERARMPTETLTEVDFPEISTEEEEGGEDETEGEDAEEEELVVIDAAEAAGCAVALPWQLTVHFRTPAAMLAAAKNSRVAAAIPATAGTGDSCCCSCAALRQQQQMPDVSGGNAATTAAATGPGATAASPAATAATASVTAGVSGGETAAALDKRANSVKPGNNVDAARPREERAAAAGGVASAGTSPSGREFETLNGEGGQRPAAATVGCSTREGGAAAASPSQRLPSSAAAGMIEYAANGGAAASGSSSVATASSCVKGSRSGSTPAARQEKIIVPPSVPPPAYEGWGFFESFFTNVIRQATFLLTGSAASFHCLARAEEAALLRALRCLDVRAFLRATAPLLTPLLLPTMGVTQVEHSPHAHRTHVQQTQREGAHRLLLHDCCTSQFRQNGQSGSSNTCRGEQTEGDVAPSVQFADTLAGEAAAESPGYGDSNAVNVAAGVFAAGAPAGSDAPPGGSQRDASYTAEEPVGSAPVVRNATDTSREATTRGTVAVTGPAATGDAGGNIAERSATKGAARAKQGPAAAQGGTAAAQGEATGGVASRKGLSRTLRRLPVRVHLVSSCCSGAACVAAAAAAAASEQHHEEVGSSEVGSFPSLSAERTTGGSWGTRGSVSMEKQIDAAAVDADDNWCCVSSVLLACPPFVPATVSYSGSSRGFEASSTLASTCLLPSNSARPCFVSRADYSTSTHASDHACDGRKEQAPSTAKCNTAFASGAAAAHVASCVDGGSSTTAGQSMYTLGHMLHDLLPQLFPVKTWKLERKPVTQCCCSFACSDGRSFCCHRSNCCYCCSVASGLTNISNCTAESRTTDLMQQHYHPQHASDCTARSSASVDTRRDGSVAAWGRAQQQDANTGGDSRHSCCRGTKLFTQSKTGQAPAQSGMAGDGDGEGKRWAKFTDLQGEGREKEEDERDNENDKEDAEEDVLEESHGEGLDDEILYIRSGFEHCNSRRSSRSCRVLVQGVEPLFDTPVYWLWLNAASFDFFLHVVVLLPPYF